MIDRFKNPDIVNILSNYVEKENLQFHDWNIFDRVRNLSHELINNRKRKKKFKWLIGFDIKQMDDWLPQ